MISICGKIALLAHLSVPPPPQQRPMCQPCFDVLLVEKGQVCAQHVQLGELLVCIVLDAVLEAAVVVVAQFASSRLVEVLGYALGLLPRSSR